MVNSSKRKLLYEGSTKIIFEGPDSESLIQHFKDDISVFNSQKKGIIAGKGVINNRISEFIMAKLSEIGIPNHFIKLTNMREQLVRKIEMLPFSVKVRNVASGDISKKLGIEEGTVLPRPIVEFRYRSNKLEHPMLSEDYLSALGWANIIEIEEIKGIALRTNDFLTGLFYGVGLRLIDFKLEMGRIYFNELEQLMIADEISPDCCRLWDIKSNEKMGKDRFALDLDKVQETYLDIAKRLGLYINKESIQPEEFTDEPIF